MCFFGTKSMKKPKEKDVEEDLIKFRVHSYAVLSSDFLSIYFPKKRKTLRLNGLQRKKGDH